MAKQEIMFGRTEKVAKIEWWSKVLLPPIPQEYWGYLIVFIALSLLNFKAIIIAFKESKELWLLMGIGLFSLITAWGLHIYFLLEGKKEYEQRKKEEKEFND